MVEINSYYDDIIDGDNADPAYAAIRDIPIGLTATETNFAPATDPRPLSDLDTYARNELNKLIDRAVLPQYQMITGKTLEENFGKDILGRQLSLAQAFGEAGLPLDPNKESATSAELQDPVLGPLLQKYGYKKQSLSEGLERTVETFLRAQRDAREKRLRGEKLTPMEEIDASLPMALLDAFDFTGLVGLGVKGAFKASRASLKYLLDEAAKGTPKDVALKKFAELYPEDTKALQMSAVQEEKARIGGGSGIPLGADDRGIALAPDRNGIGAGGTKVDIKIPKYYQGLIDKNTLGGPETKAKIEKVLRDYPDKLPKGVQQISKDYGMPNYKYLLATIYKRMSEGTLPKDYFNPQLLPGEFAGKEVQNIGSKKAAELSKQKFGPILEEIEAYYAANKSKFKDKGVAYFQSELLKNTSIKSIKDKYLYDNFSGYEDIKKPGMKKDVYNKNANKKGNQTKAEKILEKHGIYGSERARSRNNFYVLVHSYRQDPRELEKLVRASGGLTKEEFKKLNPNLSSKEINEAYPEYSFNVGQKMIDDEYKMLVDLTEPENLPKLISKIETRDNFNKWVSRQIDEYFFNPNPTPQQAAFIEKFRSALSRATKKNYDDDKVFRRALISMYKTDLSHSFPIRAYTKEFPGAGGFADLIKVNFSGINTGQQAAVDKSIKRFLKDISDLPRNPDGSFKNTPENIEIIEKKISEIQKINDDFGERLVTSIHKIDDPQVAQLLKGAFPNRVDEQGELLKIESFDEAERTKIKESKPSIVLGADIGNEPNLEDLKQYWLDHIRDGELGIKEPKFVGKRGPRGKRSPLAGIMGPVAPGTPDFSFFNQGGPVRMAIGGDPLQNINQQQFSPDPAFQGQDFFQEAVDSGNLTAFNPLKLFNLFGKVKGTAKKADIGQPTTLPRELDQNLDEVVPVLEESDFPFKSFTYEKLQSPNAPGAAKPQDWANYLTGGDTAPIAEIRDSGLEQYLRDYEKYYPNQKLTKQQIVDYFETSPTGNLEMRVKQNANPSFPDQGRSQHMNAGSQSLDNQGINYREVIVQAGPIPGEGKPFINSTHFSEPNVIAFTRVADYQLADGSTAAVIQELQTDMLNTVRVEQMRIKTLLDRLKLTDRKARDILNNPASTPDQVREAQQTIDKLAQQVSPEQRALLEQTEGIKPFPNAAGASLIPGYTDEILKLQDNVNDLLRQKKEVNQPFIDENIFEINQRQLQLRDQLLDLNRSLELDQNLKGIQVPTADQADELRRLSQKPIENIQYERTNDIELFPPVPFKKTADYVDLIIKATIKDAQARGINKVGIFTGELVNKRWNKDPTGPAGKKFNDLYSKVSVQQMNNIAKKYGGRVIEGAIVDPSKGQKGLKMTGKNVDGDFELLREISPSNREGVDEFLNDEILRIVEDYGLNDVVVRREIAPGQTMEFFATKQDEGLQLTPLGDADRAENATIIIEEFNPSLVKIPVLVLDEAEKAKEPFFLYRKKDGGKIASDGLVSITDIYGDY